MKRNIFLPLCLVSVFLINSNTGFTQYSFGIGPTFGFGPSSLTYQSSATGTTYKGVSSPHVGIAGVFKIKDQLALQIGLIVNSDEDNITGNSSEGTYHHTNGYLKVPVDLMYVIKTGPGQFDVGGGPFFSKVIKGNTKDLSFNNNLPDDQLKNGDWGLDLRAEYLFRVGFFVSLYYSAGLENLSMTQGDPAVHTSSAGISFGFLFGWHKRK